VPTYTWSTGAQTQNVSGLSSGIYTLTIGTGGPCNMVLTYTVTQPTALTYTLSSDTLDCYGDTGSVRVSVGGGTPASLAPAYAVNWSSPPGGSGFAVHGLGAGTYAGTITDSLGCTATFTTTTTQPLPIAVGYTYTAGCLGSPVQFTDQSSGGPFTYSWNYGDGTTPLGNTQNPQHTYATSGSYTTSLIVINSNNCQDTLTRVVTVDPPPQADFIGDTLAGCPTHDVLFTDQSVCSFGTITSWHWDFGNGTSSVMQYPGLVYYDNTSAITNANYLVSLTVVSSKGCTSTVVKNNYVSVYPRPIPGFYFTNDDGTSQIDILDNNVHFYSTAQGATIYNWYLGDIFANPFSVNYTTIVNPIHQYINEEPYTYFITQEVENQYGCKDSVTLPLTIKPVYTFYMPNSFSPNADGVNEEFGGSGIGIDNNTYKMWVFDRWGNQIFTSNDINKPWDGRVKGKGDVAQEDVYVWKVSFTDIVGLKHEFHGVVSIVK
jgi:gliding motility-associated-like protein